MRLKTLEEGLKHSPTLAFNTYGSPKNDKSLNFFGILSSNSRNKKRCISQPRASTISKTSMEKKNPPGENLSRKSLWASRNKVIDNSEKENAETNKNGDITEMGNIKGTTRCNKEMKSLEVADMDSEDMVSGVLYDRLQREVINLRKSSELKDVTLHSKDEEIQVGYCQLFFSVCVSV